MGAPNWIERTPPHESTSTARASRLARWARSADCAFVAGGLAAFALGMAIVHLI